MTAPAAARTLQPGEKVAVTMDNVLSSLAHSIERHGGRDFVYDSAGGCEYARQEGDETVPDCGIGCQLTDLGVPLEALYRSHCSIAHSFGFDTAIDGRQWHQMTPTQFLQVCEQMVKTADCAPLAAHVAVEASALWVMQAFQAKQDNRIPWGDAYDFAAGVHRLLSDREEG